MTKKQKEKSNNLSFSWINESLYGKSEMLSQLAHHSKILNYPINIEINCNLKYL